MPASARKSSLGNLRRGPQKYIPYRADDFQHGKKTGIAVGYVDRLSDEFEPFEKVISQADNRTPFRPQVVRKRRGPKTPVVVQEPELDDEDGEMSMELDDSVPNSPSAYFAHTRINTITSSVQRVGSSSRPVAHTSDVDFDEVPSPRASPSYTARKSLPHSRSIQSSRPSRLSQSVIPEEDDDDDDIGGGAPDYGDYGNDMDEEDDHTQHDMQTTRSGLTSRRTSFTQMGQEADEEAEVEDEMTFDRSPSEKARGKQRANFVSPPPLPPDDNMEPEIEQALREVDEEPMEEEEDELRSKKGGKGRRNKDAKTKDARKENAQPRTKPRQRKDMVLRELTPEENTDGVRRSKRLRYSPLAWWRLEKVVYGRRESGTCLVPSIKEIHRIPQPQPEPLGARKRRGASRKRSRTVDPEIQQVIVYDPEEGWDDQTDPHCDVLEYGQDGMEVTRRVAFTAKMVAPKAAAQGAFYFQKIFGDGDFLAAGQLIIPPHSTKPTKGTKDNTFVFYVIQGAVKFAVHKSNFILSTGGMFMVPRGNVYYIQNICERDAKLFFAQARKMPEEIKGAADGEASENEGRARSRSTALAVRRESTGRASSDTVNAEEHPKSKSRRGTSAKS
ncbi:Mif2/CENP-C like-domain-containing protein [Trametes punicea]|nr:Mif2/CENP-C like-domain-containing protein [Trametes punicea]